MRHTHSLAIALSVITVVWAGQATDLRARQASGACVSGIFSDGATTSAHGLNERILVRSLMEGREFLYRLTKVYADAR